MRPAPARRGRCQRVVEASDQGRHPIRDRFGRSEVKGAQPGSASTLGRHEIHRLLVRRRLADHHDPRSFREQDVAEASGIGGHPDRLGRRQLREGDRRTATGQDEPGGPLPSGDRGDLVRAGFGAGRRQGDHAGSIGRARQRLVQRWLTCCQHAGPASAAPPPAADCSSQGAPSQAPAFSQEERDAGRRGHRGHDRRRGYGSRRVGRRSQGWQEGAEGRKEGSRQGGEGRQEGRQEVGEGVRRSSEGRQEGRQEVGEGVRRSSEGRQEGRRQGREARHEVGRRRESP